MGAEAEGKGATSTPSLPTVTIFFAVEVEGGQIQDNHPIIRLYTWKFITNLSFFKYIEYVWGGNFILW